MFYLYCTIDTILPSSGETPNKLIEFSAKSKDVSKNSVIEINNILIFLKIKNAQFRKASVIRTSLDLHINFVLYIVMNIRSEESLRLCL